MICIIHYYIFVYIVVSYDFRTELIYFDTEEDQQPPASTTAIPDDGSDIGSSSTNSRPSSDVPESEDGCSEVDDTHGEGVSSKWPFTMCTLL